jgi:hypothetical protein
MAAKRQNRQWKMKYFFRAQVWPRNEKRRWQKPAAFEG